jgi:hypothetical protein
MRIVHSIGLGLLLLAGVPVWSQEQPAVPVPAAVGPVLAVSPNSNDDADRMPTPPPVSGENYPVSFASEERANYLRGGVTFNTAYSDNVLGATSNHPVSDVSYSVWPTLALDETTPRLHWTLNYAPGFTFYQRTGSRNETDQTAAVDFQYRLSPHVTLAARDAFQKTSNVFNQPDLGAAGAVSGGIQQANQSVIAPVADRLSNSGNVGITYQFAANSMIGASGTFTNLHYPNPAQVPGLFDSESQGGSAFYSFRITKMHTVGVTYQYQRLLSYPAPGTNQTQTHAMLAFYTLYLTPRFSISVFGGPQYADSGPQFLETATSASPAARSWNPAAGGSLSWQGRLSNLALSYSHLISSGGGLIGAVRTDSASASIGQQLSRTLSASVAGGYAQNDLLAATPLLGANGHTVSGTAGLQQQFGQHLNLQLGYTRLHQDYSLVAVLAATPNTNREFISLSYQFSRPLGR